MFTSPEERQVESTETSPNQTQTNTAELADDAAELAFFNNTEASRSELPAATEAAPIVKGNTAADEDDADGKKDTDESVG